MSETFESPTERIVTAGEELDLCGGTERHIFGLAGLPGCGKSTAADTIESMLRENFEYALTCEMSSFVREEYRDTFDGATCTDNELGEWAASMKDEHGNGYFARQLAEYFETATHHHMIVPGLRSPAEAEALREVYGDDNVTVIAIWTLPDVRFERKYGETPSTEHPEWETFQERNEREIHEWGCGSFFMREGPSDYLVSNNSRVGAFEIDLETIVGHEVFGDDLPESWRDGFDLLPDLDREGVEQYL
jgi:dephospho-CoA kinase